MNLRGPEALKDMDEFPIEGVFAHHTVVRFANIRLVTWRHSSSFMLTMSHLFFLERIPGMASSTARRWSHRGSGDFAARG
jgi:hypothetical protein